MIIYSTDFSKASEISVLFLTIKKRYEENIASILSSVPEETLNRIIKFSDSVWASLLKYLETGKLDNQETLQLKGDTKILKRLLTVAFTSIKTEESSKKTENIVTTNKFNVAALFFFSISALNMLVIFYRRGKELKSFSDKIKKHKNLPLNEAFDKILSDNQKEKELLESDYRREHFILTRYTALLDALSTSIIELDSNKKIIYANDSFAQTFNKGKKPVGETISTLLPELTYDSTRFYHEKNIYWIEKKEVSETIFIVFMDITEQENMSDRLINSERLITMGELASRVTHEIRNPLSTIKLNSEYLYSNAGSISPNELKTFLELITKETARLEEITGKYMGMSGYGQDTSKNTVLPEDLIETVNFLKTETDKRNIDLLIDNIISQTLEMKRSSLKEIIINLIKNSWEEIEKNGTIIISTEIDRNNHRYMIHFDDSGKGIPESEREIIFKKFFTKKSGGTGIGLAHSRKTAEENGGTLTVSDSKLLSGARFTLSLPYSTPSGEI